MNVLGPLELVVEGN